MLNSIARGPAIAVLMLAATAAPISVRARTWLITPDGAGDAATIQAGVDSAAAGDTLLLASGVYTGEGNRDVDFGGKDLALVSENGPDVTVIDCEGTELEPHRAFVFQNYETPAALVEGITVTHGYAVGEGHENRGGGVLCDRSSPSCVFRTNLITDSARS